MSSFPITLERELAIILRARQPRYRGSRWQPPGGIGFVQNLRKEDLEKKLPAVAETLDWAAALLRALDMRSLDEDIDRAASSRP